MVGCGLASRRVTYRTRWFPLLEDHRRREVDLVLQGGASATVAHLRVNKACQGEGAGTQKKGVGTNYCAAPHSHKPWQSLSPNEGRSREPGLWVPCEA